MGCSFSQTTYLYHQKGNQSHSPLKGNAERILGNQALKIKDRSNLRIANQIYAENYFSASNSLLQTDRQMCSFLKKTQKDLQKSKFRIYQSQNSSKRQVQSQMKKNDIPSNTTNKSDNSSKENCSNRRKGNNNQIVKNHQAQYSQEASQIPRNMIQSVLILQEINVGINEELCSSPEMLQFSMMESIQLQDYSSKGTEQQMQIITNMMESHLFLNSNNNAKHKKKKSVLRAQNNPKFTQIVSIEDSNVDSKQTQIHLAFKNNNLDNNQGQQQSCSFSGKGTLKKADGRIYVGFFKQGMLQGMGELFCRDGFHYEGQFVRNLPEGFGKANYADKSTYVGYFKKGLKHGKGLFTQDENTYDGDFVENRMQGKGLFFGKNGYMYQGEWQNNMKHGKGKQKLQNGDTYVGQFQKDMKQGYGIINYADGTSVEGYWQKDSKSNKGNSFRIRNSKLAPKTERKAKKIL